MDMAKELLPLGGCRHPVAVSHVNIPASSRLADRKHDYERMIWTRIIAMISRSQN